MMLVDKAQLLTLTAPEMTVLVGGMRVLDTNADGPSTASSRAAGNAHQRLLREPARYERQMEEPSKQNPDVYERHNRKTGKVEWTGTRVDLIFGSNSELRALAEVYGSRTRSANSSTIRSAWTKVMNADRYDIKR